MTKQKHSIPAALLALCLLLTACGGQQDAAPSPLSQTEAYTSDIIPLDLPLTELTASAASGRNLYLAGLEEEESEDDGLSNSFSYSTSASSDGDSFTFYSGGGGRAVLYRVDSTAGTAVKLEGYAPESGVSIASIVPCEDGSLWVLEETSGSMELDSIEGMEDAGSVSVSMNGPSSVSQVWRRLSATGAEELERIDVANPAEAEAFSETMIDASGRLYAVNGANVVALDTSGAVLFTCKGQDPIEKLIPLSGGGVGAVTGGDSGRTVYPIDPEAQTFAGPLPLTGSADRFYAGDESRSFLFTSGDSLYGWPKDTASPEKLLSWSGAGIDRSQVVAAAFLPDGQGAALLQDGTVWPASYSLARLSPAGEEDLAGRKVLTLATLGLRSEIRTRVLEFNRTSGTHRIEIRDYSEFNTPGDISAGLNKLNTEILAGNMPDLLDVSAELSLRRYAAKGLLEDLWPYIESDSALGREKLMERPLEAAEIDGKLYQIFPRFAIATAAGAASAVGKQTGWTLAELRDALAGQPAGCSVLKANETRESVFESMFAGSLDEFVDWETGCARFDSPEFRAILEFCAAFPAQAQNTAVEETDAYTRVLRGEQLLLPVYLSDLTSVQIYQSIFSGNMTFVGYPSESGSAASFAAEGGSLALSASCQEKEAAWSFLRQALLPSEEKVFNGFPINREDFDLAAAESMKITYAQDEDGNLITGPDGEPLLEGTVIVFIGGQPVMLKPATEEDYQQVMTLYEATSRLSELDENIWSIVRECAGACFAGDRTAEDAARDAQNRVELYLNEQR